MQSQKAVPIIARHNFFPLQKILYQSSTQVLYFQYIHLRQLKCGTNGPAKIIETYYISVLTLILSDNYLQPWKIVPITDDVERNSFASKCITITHLTCILYTV